MDAIVSQHHDDGADADLGRSWSVVSGPLSGPLGIRTELHGTIGERLGYAPTELFWWEAWHDVRDMGTECYAQGYVPSFDAALDAIRGLWATSPLADAAPYTPSRRGTFAERMAGR